MPVQRIAVIDGSNTVINVIIADLSSYSDPVHILVPSDSAGIGWIWAGGTAFSQPTIPIDYTTISTGGSASVVRSRASALWRGGQKTQAINLLAKKGLL